jgi:hypothetical protein
MISPMIGEYIINETVQQFVMISLTIGDNIINSNHWPYTRALSILHQKKKNTNNKKKKKLLVMINPMIGGYIINLKNVLMSNIASL